jgi:hypothetical protein
VDAACTEMEVVANALLPLGTLMHVCEECVRLAQAWYEAVGEFSDCVGRLEACCLDGFRFQEHHKSTEIAREKAETARVSLRTHRAEHEYSQIVG